MRSEYNPANGVTVFLVSAPRAIRYIPLAGNGYKEKKEHEEKQGRRKKSSMGKENQV